MNIISNFLQDHLLRNFPRRYNWVVRVIVRDKKILYRHDQLQQARVIIGSVSHTLAVDIISKWALLYNHTRILHNSKIVLVSKYGAFDRVKERISQQYGDNLQQCVFKIVKLRKPSTSVFIQSCTSQYNDQHHSVSVPYLI